MMRAEVLTVVLFCFLALGMAAKLPLGQKELGQAVKAGFRSMEAGILRMIRDVFESPVVQTLQQVYVMGRQSLDMVSNIIEDIKLTNCIQNTTDTGLPHN